MLELPLGILHKDLGVNYGLSLNGRVGIHTRTHARTHAQIYIYILYIYIYIYIYKLMSYE